MRFFVLFYFVYFVFYLQNRQVTSKVVHEWGVNFLTLSPVFSGSQFSLWELILVSLVKIKTPSVKDMMSLDGEG